MKTNTCECNQAEIDEYLDERAGIREYDGEQSKDEAEAGAREDCERWLRAREKPQDRRSG